MVGLMSWFYDIRASNRLIESKGGFAAEEEARAAGRARASMMTSGVGAPGGTQVLTLMVGRNDSDATISVPVDCPACKTKQTVLVAAHAGGFAQMNEETIACVKCNGDVHVRVPDRIVGGPYAV